VRASVVEHTKSQMLTNGVKTSGKDVIDARRGGVLGDGRLLTICTIARVVLFARIVRKKTLRR
jgi:hypothetical protein